MEARYLTDLEWRICHAVNIYVFRNGRDGEQPILVHIPPAKKKNMRSVMNVIQDRVKYPVGYAKFLYKMDGTRIKDPCELEMYNNYVVASNFEKHFKCAAYGRKRSPLLVLNRDSKHVRVLKLQNQNYYEWLLKKKAVGEERPPYIYPAYYTNQNYRPQDLPTGHMGNYNPPEAHAPGCCYPSADGGRTYRVENGRYVVNTVTVDVSPDLVDLRELPRDKRNPKQGQSYRRSKYGGKIIEQTPSDMLNANVSSPDGASQDGISVETSGTEEKVKMSKKIRASKHRKTKSHRVHVVTSEEFHEQQSVDVIETSSQTSVDRRNLVPTKSGKRSKKNKETHAQTEYVGLPPAPAQFRDGDDISNNNNPQYQPQMTLQLSENQEILKFVDKAIHDSNSTLPGHKAAFFYSPEKLAQISSSGNISPLEFTFSNTQAVPSGPWTLIQQPQQQILQPVYTIEPQHTARLIPAQTTVAASHPTPVLNSFTTTPQNPGILPNFQLQPSARLPNQVPMLHTISPQPPTVFHHHTGQTPQQCVVIPNDSSALRSSQQPLQPSLGTTNLNMTQSPQFVALPGPPGQSHLHHVYQLGIVQQPNPQTCIQVDAKAMRQYVDNQKMLESRLQQTNDCCGEYIDAHTNAGRKPCPQQRHDLTESELDIPFTPLKTYRLNSNFARNKRPSNPLISHETRHYENRERRSRPDRLSGLGKVKSRNVAIQMGHPGPSERSYQFPHFEHFGGSYPDVSANPQDRRNYFPNPFPVDYMPRVSANERSLANGRGSYDRFMFNKDRALRRAHNSVGPSCSDSIVHLNSSRDYNPISQNRRLSRISDPLLEDLLTIPPPSEFRGLETTHFSSRHALNRQPNSNSYLQRSNVYPYASNDRSETTSQQYNMHYSLYP